ncbi:MAG: sigma-54 dependent transcriptional regulator [Luminiphilus sp.]|nr:sigma-54 dependent transcriptional regulator [Luminiphilus sp.]
MLTVLLLDDDPISATHTADDLTAEGFKIIKASPFSALGAIKSAEKVDVVLLDPGRNEAGVKQLINDLQPLPILIHAQHASLRSAVDLMKLGVRDYWPKPAPPRDLLRTIKRVVRPATETSATSAPAVDAFVGRSSGMRSLMNMANKAAKARSTVLIIGETGTGKELVAQHIHQASQRTHKPLISVNCAAIPETLIESELFGYEKGAFTGANAQRLGLIEAADGGTLFLDEIGELPASAQARLLRFIQEGEIRRIGSVESASVDVRLICATHRNLMELENTDVFRRDLFHRINVLRLELPPLRERGDDIEGLTKFLIKRVSTKLQLDAKPLSPDAKKALSSYPWPGNVRELEHTIERALVLADGEVLEPHDLNLSDKPTKSKGVANPFASASAVIEPEPTANNDTDSGELSLEDYFQRFVLENQDAMNETEIAQKLGISRKCLWERRQRFDLPRTRKKGST